MIVQRCKRIKQAENVHTKLNVLLCKLSEQKSVQDCAEAITSNMYMNQSHEINSHQVTQQGYTNFAKEKQTSKQTKKQDL